MATCMVGDDPAREQDVLRLEVSICDPQAVKMLQRYCDACRVELHVLLREAPHVLIRQVRVEG